MALNRVKQWMTFSRVWYLFDAKWQDPVVSGQVLAKYLLGKNKPIFSVGSDCGDFVVVINSKEITLKNDLWRTYKFFHHTRYAQGAKYTPAWKFHENDPTRIITQCTKMAMPPKMYKNIAAYRLVVFPDDKIPEDIIQNVADQISPQRAIPKRLDEYTPEEIQNFPRLFEWPKEFVIDDLKGLNNNESVSVKISDKK